jgi:hypothetical protein
VDKLCISCGHQKNTIMKSYAKAVAAQTTAILIAAAGAALIAFIGSLATQTGACGTSTISVADATMMGGSFKAAHAALLFSQNKV